MSNATNNSFQNGRFRSRSPHRKQAEIQQHQSSAIDYTQKINLRGQNESYNEEDVDLRTVLRSRKPRNILQKCCQDRENELDHCIKKYEFEMSVLREKNENESRKNEEFSRDYYGLITEKRQIREKYETEICDLRKERSAMADMYEHKISELEERLSESLKINENYYTIKGNLEKRSAMADMHENQISELKEKLSNWYKIKGNLEAKIEDLQSKNINLNRLKDEKYKQCQKMEKQLKENNNNWNELLKRKNKTLIENSNKQILKLRNEIDNLKTNLKNNNMKNDKKYIELENKNNELEYIKRQMESKLLEKDKKFDEAVQTAKVELETNFRIQTSELLEKNQTFEAQKLELEKENEAFKAELAEISRNCNKYQKQVSDFEKQNQNCKKINLEKLNEALEGQKIELVKQNHQALESQRLEFEKEKQSSEKQKKEIENLNHLLCAQKEEISQKTKQISNFEKQKQVQRVKLEKRNQAFESQKLEFEKLSQAFKIQKTELDAQKLKIEGMENKMKISETAIKQLNETASVKHKRYLKLKKKSKIFDKQVKENSDLKTERDNFKNRWSECQKRLVSFEEKNKELHNKINNIMKFENEELANVKKEFQETLKENLLKEHTEAYEKKFEKIKSEIEDLKKTKKETKEELKKQIHETQEYILQILNLKKFVGKLEEEIQSLKSSTEVRQNTSIVLNTENTAVQQQSNEDTIDVGKTVEFFDFS